MKQIGWINDFDNSEFIYLDLRHLQDCVTIHGKLILLKS